MKILLLFAVMFQSTYITAQKTDSLAPRVYEWQKLETKIEGTRITRPILEGSTTSLSHFEVHSTTIEPGKAPHAAHQHDDVEELLIVKDGQLKISIKDESRILGRGSVVFMMPGDMHGIENAGKTNATYYILKYKSKQGTNLNRASQNGGSFIVNWDDIPRKPNEKGGRRDFFNRPTSQLVKFEMHTTALNVGLDSHAQHTHKEEEIILILTGNVTMHIANDFLKAAPGDIVFLPSGIPHALKNTGNVQCEYFAFQWRN